MDSASTEYRVPKSVQGPGQTSFWSLGLFFDTRSGAIQLFDDNMDSRLYIAAMQTFMKPSVRFTWPNGVWFYLHDNATYHRSREYFTLFHNQGVDLIELPPHSLDIKPI
jgi:hypothetical protein